MFQKHPQWIWMNGEMIPWNQANIHVSAHALHYGNGVFEGIRCYETANGPALFRVNDHLDRLYTSAGIYEMRIPYSSSTLLEAICEVVQRNELRECYIRPICFFAGHLAVRPVNDPVEVAVLAMPFYELTSKESKKQGLRVMVSSRRKFHGSMVPTTAKACGQYVNSILAIQEAARNGYDEAVLLDVNGHIAEGSAENVFLVKGKMLLTNDQHSSILLGITRDTVIQIARDLGLGVEVRTMTLDDVHAADEVFMTGTALEIVAVREVDGRQIGADAPGPVTEVIQRSFHAAVRGRDSRYRSWLHLVHASTVHAMSGQAINAE